MKKVKVYLQYCYGIKKLDYEFDFSIKKIFSLYAPNGVMKTSFAKTLKDLKDGGVTKDIMFPERETIRSIKDNDDKDIDKSEIYVIPPYVDDYSFNKETTLLVNKKLKEDYDDVHRKINKEKDVFFKKLKQLSGLTGRGNNIEDEILETFGGKKIFDVIENIESRVLNSNVSEFSNITYIEIFNDKVLPFLKTQDFKIDIREYIEKYHELIENSEYLKKGFNHYHASTVQKSLKDNGFFNANHSLNLFDGKSKKEILQENELEEILKLEKEKVFSDQSLKDKFDKIDKKLSNADLRKFRDYLFDNKEIIPELEDLEKFRINLWVGYFKDQEQLLKNLLSEYKAGKLIIEKIVKQAKSETTEWQKVVDIFNKRFSVPFQLYVDNTEDVILKSDVPSVKFIFEDSGENKKVDKDSLLKVLSQGEKRALYILNIVFDVETRKNLNQKTLFIVDDIADSFDYKNKYAIIEYLKEISEVDNFYQIILTHNFDFYRTVSSRLDIGRKNRLNIVKTENEIIIKQEIYQKNPFDTWKDNLHNKDIMLIASIPFVRNLCDYCGYDDEFKKLTSLLHIKSNTMSFTLKNLEDIYKIVLQDKKNMVLKDSNRVVIVLIYELAEEILSIQEEKIELEQKLVLAIAIRLKTEEFIIDKINDKFFIATIDENQTYELIKKYKEDYPLNEENIQLFEKVNLMTPDGIHINSFMYEPIIDMSNNHLKQLYGEVKVL